jgi:hypothetical protein
MRIAELIEWQRLDYACKHRLRGTLLVHLVAVPVFVAGNAALVAALLLGMWTAGALALAVMMASLAWQGRCHRGEPEQPAPFSGPAEAVARIFIEQWVTFPRFVFSGEWALALREAPRQPGCFTLK